MEGSYSVAYSRRIVRHLGHTLIFVPRDESPRLREVAAVPVGREADLGLLHQRVVVRAAELHLVEPVQVAATGREHEGAEIGRIERGEIDGGEGRAEVADDGDEGEDAERRDLSPSSSVTRRATRVLTGAYEKRS